MKNKILYIDDDLLNLKLYGKLFDEIGKTICISNGYQALEELSKNNFSLIVVDIHLPVIDGFEIVKKIKEHQKYNKCPIFFLSADESQVVKLKGLSCEVDDYIAKSMPSEEIKMRAQNHIKKFLNNNKNKFEITYGPILVNTQNISVHINHQLFLLTLIEYKILYFLVKNNGQIASKDELIYFIWPNEEIRSHTLNTHLSNLRSKISHTGIQIIIEKDKQVRLTF